MGIKKPASEKRHPLISIQLALRFKYNPDTERIRRMNQKQQEGHQKRTEDKRRARSSSKGKKVEEDPTVIGGTVEERKEQGSGKTKRAEKKPKLSKTTLIG